MHKIGSLIGSTRTTSISTGTDHQAVLNYQNQGDLERARANYIQALELADQVCRTDSTQAEVNRTLARINQDYAGLLEDLDCYAEAEEAYQQAQIYAQKACDIETDHVGHALLVEIQRNYKRFLRSQKESTEADQARRAAVAYATQEKNKQVNYLFEKALSTLSSLKLTDSPSLFLVYAHDNPTYGRAEAGTAKYLINKLSQIRVNLYSDQTPMGQPYVSISEALKNDGKSDDILTSQLCLLPGKLRDDVEPVDKVIVCCSEVLGKYLEWEHYGDFYRELHAAYCQDWISSTTSAIRNVVEKFSQQAKYKAEFHHVLTEMAFLQIRKEHLEEYHGIIPVPLTPNSHAACLAHFIPETSVRIGDIPRLDAQSQAGREVYLNQSQHIVLFKVIERLLFHDAQAKPFLDQFWKGYSTCVNQLKEQSGALDWHQFAELVDDIFGQIQHEIIRRSNRKIETKLAHIDEKLDNLAQKHQTKQLQAFQQEHKPLAELGEDIARFKQNYQHYLKSSGEIQDALAMYVPLHGLANPTATESFDLETHIERFLSSEEKTVLLLLGAAGSGKSTFNRYLAKKKLEAHQRIEKGQGATPLVFFIELRRREKPNQNVIQAYLQEEGFNDQQIQLLQTHQRCLFIFDGYDEIQESERNRHFYDQNKLWQWQHAKFIVTSRPEYLAQRYAQYFHPKGYPQRLQETWIAPFSLADRATYINKYVQRHQANLYPIGWDAARYQAALSELSTLQAELNRPVVLRMMLAVLPTLSVSDATDLTLSAVYEAYFEQWWSRWEERIAEIQLTPEEAQAKAALTRQGGFVRHGFAYSQQCALALTKAKRGDAENTQLFKKEAPEAHALFFDDSARARLLRFNAPLSRNTKGDYQFPHKSMQEYWVARAIRMAGDPTTETGLTYLPPAPDGLLNTLNLINEPDILNFLVEEVKQKEAFKAHLLAWIEASKGNAEFAQGAANAITVLVRAGVQFNGADLSGIRIPGANLSYGVFDSVQWLGADLRNVNLMGAWLQNADLSGTLMEGVQFGELPGLQFEDEVNACCYSSDGQLLVVAHGSTITLHDAQTLEEQGRLIWHKGDVRSVVLSADGRYLVSGSEDNTVRVWDWQTPEAAPRVLSGHEYTVTSVALSADGRYVVSGSEDNTVRVWDWQTPEAAPCILIGHEDRVSSVAMSANGRYLVSGSEDNTVRVWDWRTPEAAPRVLSGHEEWVMSVGISADGRYLVSSSVDTTVRVWDWQTPEAAPRVLIGHEDGVNNVALSADGRYVFSGGWDKTVRVWDWQTPEAAPRVLRGHESRVTSVALSADGRYVVSGGGKTVRVWDWQTPEAAPRVLSGHEDWVASVVMSADGRYLVSGGSDTVRVWDWQTLEAAPRVLSGHEEWVHSVVMSADGRYLVSGSKDKTVRVWDWQTPEAAPRVFSGHEDEVRCVALSADGRYLVSGSQDRTVRIWDWQTPKVAPRVLRGHGWLVNSVVMSTDGRYVVSGSWDATVRVWDWQTPEAAPRVLSGHDSDVTSVALSADGRYVASGSHDKTVRVWDWQTPEAAPRVLSEHEDWVTSVALSADGRYLASGSEDKTVRVWDIASGQRLAIIHGFNGNVKSVAWQNIDGIDYLITGSHDKMVRCWQWLPANDQWQLKLRWTSGQEVLTLVGAKIDGVEGLSLMNSRLLKQRGATGEPSKIKEEESPPSLIASAETSALMAPIPARSPFNLA